MRSILAVLTFLLVACGGPTGDNGSNGAGSDTIGAGTNVTSISNEVAVANSGQDASADKVAAARSPCMTQGPEALSVTPIRATGTEPFWSASIEGRCVTYSTPEKQDGVRVWTRYSETAGNRKTWIGQLDGKKFELLVHPEPGCSDGMSDNSYPLSAELTLGQEKVRGCASSL